MVPADIDWKTIESRYMKDELYEHINAPKWLDLSAPDSVLVDDEAWFCRADCKHPKSYEDFKKISPSPKMKSGADVKPLGERKINNQSLKRRGAVAALLPLPSSPVSAKNKGNAKNYRTDLENQDPNMDMDTCTYNTPHTKALIKSSKEEIKSSAEKIDMEEEVNVEIKSNKKIPRLKSTLSARNLFSGRDILSQLSEFCHEIKKIAVGKVNGREIVKEEERKVLLDTNSRVKIERSAKSVKRVGKLTVKVENNEINSKKMGEINNSSILKEVRAHPPTPQKFPSPSTHCLLAKTGTSTVSPLNRKPLKPETQVQVKEEKRELVAKEDNEEGGGSSLDIFWFFKPCTA